MFLGSAGAADAAEIVRGPYLQKTTSDSTLVVLRTDEPATVELEMNGVVAAQSDGTDHVMSLDGLRPGSEVRYGVRVDGVSQGPWTFKTPGLPGTPEGSRAVIGVIGDMGSGGPLEKENVKRMAERGVELILTVGDNSYPHGAPEEYDPKFFRPFSPLLTSATIYPSLGDHEYHTPGAAGYLDAFFLPEDGPGGERFYSFDWGDVHVTVLDTQCLDPSPNSGGDEPVPPECAQMVEWFEQDVANSRAPWKLVAMHRQAVASGKYGYSKPVAKALIPIFEEHGVDVVFQGHTHFYERTWPMRDGKTVKKSYVEPGAPVYVTSGGGGDWIYESEKPQPEWSAFRATEFQHMQLTLDGGELRLDSIRPDGTVLDSFTIQKNYEPVAPVEPTPADAQPLDPKQEEPEPVQPGASAGTGNEETCEDGDCGTVLERFRRLLSTLGLEQLLR